MSSPARKRQRLSSPTYDDQVHTSQEELDAFDAVMRSLQPETTRPSFAPASFSAASNIPLSGFGSARDLPASQNVDQPTSSPQEPQEPDLNSWFDPSTAPVAMGFQSAGFSSASSMSIEQPSALSGFSSASGAKKLFQPSSSALAQQKQKMNEIWTESDNPLSTPPTSPRKRKENSCPPSPHTPSASQQARNIGFTRPTSSQPAKPPDPVGFQAASLGVAPIKMTQGFKTPLLTQRAFRSPLLNSTPSSNADLRPASSTPSPSTQPSFSQPTFNAPRPILPGTSPLITPRRPGSESGFSTPVKSIGISKRTMQSPGRFKSPLKAGWKPLETSKSKLSNVLAAGSTPSTPVKRHTHHPVFDLSKRPNRSTLQSSRLLPSSYTEDELQDLGIDTASLSQITPLMTRFYKFSVQDSSGGPEKFCGPEQVLEDLLGKGCHLAKQEWVDNHWTFILWKLAAMVALDPTKETDPHTRRWCWDEVMRQFFYRYEREINMGIRPPLRQVATQDVPASLPMVLCISRVHLPDTSPDAEEDAPEPRPELDVTDGWYQLRAEVDEPLARAIRRGIIRMGRKIVVSGAVLQLEGKQPNDILEAYESSKLVLSGNSSHLAPWHAKLGFQRGPFMSTLHSLTPDGGLVSILDVVILKVHPLVYLEFKEDEEGNKYREGPRNEVDEMKEVEKWQRRREAEHAKLWTEQQKEWDRYQAYAERLEARATKTSNNHNSSPDYIESLYDGLDDPQDAKATLSRVSGSDAGWLASCIRSHVERNREAAQEDIERQLAHACPPRQVRDFRVLVVKDAVTNRKPGNRVAALTVWDAKSLNLYEGSASGTFKVGDRFMISNLVPSSLSCWMNNEPGSEIHLTTKRNTAWRKLPRV